MKIETYKLSNGQSRYRFQIRLGDKVTRRGGFRSRNEAIFEYSNLLNQHTLSTSDKIKFKDVYSEWLSIYITKVKQSTYYSTVRVFELHILPFFEEMYVDEIESRDCQEFAMSLIDFVKGKEYFNQASRVLDYALKMDRININPFTKVVLPNFKISEKKINFLEPGEVNTLLNYFKNNQYWYTLFRLMIYSGLRRGEVLALEWDDVNFNKNTINVNKSLSIGKDAKVFVSTTKTTKSTRILSIDKETMLSIKKLKIQSKSHIVFPNKNGEYNRLSNISDRLNTAIKHTGISKIRVHDLRHTHASLLFASGANAKEVQDRLGHTDIATTMNIYTHVTKNKKKESLDNFVNYLEKYK